MRERWIGIVGGALLAVTLAPGEVPACENGVAFRTDPRVQQVAEAERLVGQGKTEAAVALLRASDPAFGSSVPGASPLRDRALSVLARAVARSDGRDGPREALGGGEGQRQMKALAWAANVTRAISLKRSDDTSAATDLGEVLSHMPDGRVEAKRLLASLEQRDLVASAHGYAALATLRARRGESAAPYLREPLRALESARRELSLARCAKMTKDKAICTGIPIGS